MMKKTFQRALSWLLVLTMLLAMAVTAGFSVSAEDSDTDWYTGDGPYTLSDEGDLLGLASLVNGGNTFSDKEILLANDITLTSTWSCTGTFSGTLDGQGYSVSDLAGSTGLFGTLAGGTVKNLTLTVALSTTTSLAKIGAIAGSCTGGTVENVTVKGSVAFTGTVKDYAVGGLIGATESSTSSILIKDVTMLASVSGAQRVGGLIGRHGSETTLTVQNTVVNATLQGVTSNQYSIGGLVGCMSSPAVLEDVVISGTISALKDRACGVCGTLAASLTADRVYVNADITATSVGAGFVGETEAKAKTVTLTDCVFAGRVANTTTLGSASAFCSAATGSNITYTFTRCISVGTVGSALGENNTTYNTFLVVIKTGLTMKMTDCYLVSSLSNGVACGSQVSSLTLTKENLQTVDALDNIQGAKAAKALSALDFEGGWTLTDSYPMPTSCADLLNSAAVTVEARQNTIPDEDGNYNTRLCGFINGYADYTEAGFIVNGVTCSTNTVYSSLQANFGTTQVTTEAFGRTGGYILAIVIEDFHAGDAYEDIKVIPYVVTADGVTVYGAAKTVDFGDPPVEEPVAGSEVFG